MNQLKRVFLLSLALCLAAFSLVGCSDNTISKEDYSQTVAATFGDENIYLDEANFLLRLTQVQYDYNYYSYYGSYPTASFYEQDTSTAGKTYWDQIKEDTMAVILQTRILCAKAEELGVSLTEEDEASVKESVNSFLEETDSAVLEASGANEALLTAIYEKNLLANKVFDVLTEDYDTTVTRDDFKQISVQYIMLLDDEDDETDDDALIEKVLEDVQAAAKEVESGETIDMDAIIEKYEDDDAYADFSLYSGERSFGEDDDSTDFGTASFKLSTGESTSVKVESTYYTARYVIYCVNDYDEEATDEAIQEEYQTRRETLFSEIYPDIQAAAPEFTVVDKVFDQLVYVTIFSNETTTAETEEESSSEAESTTEDEGSTTGEATEESTLEETTDES